VYVSVSVYLQSYTIIEYKSSIFNLPKYLFRWKNESSWSIREIKTKNPEQFSKEPRERRKNIFKKLEFLSSHRIFGAKIANDKRRMHMGVVVVQHPFTACTHFWSLLSHSLRKYLKVSR